MHYKESGQILQLIKQAKRILINCHEHPDADSVGGALAMQEILQGFGKEVTLICPEAISQELLFLPRAKTIDSSGRFQ
jgi:nanoRNase/pAp phosphatase (c-di-AMP/oligoRNAs hydrolase)